MDREDGANTDINDQEHLYSYPILTWIVSESTNGVPQDVYKKTLIVATVLRETAIVKLPIIYPALKALSELRDVCLSAGDSSC